MPPSSDAPISNDTIQQPGEQPASTEIQSAPKHAYEITSEDPTTDPDEIAAREAERLAAAEAGGDPATAPPESDQQQEEPPQTPAAPATAPAGDGSQVMIPKARLDHEIGRRQAAEEKVDKLAEQVAYLTGRFDQMAQQGGPQGQSEQPPAPPPDPREQRLAELKTQMVEVEEAYNDTRLTGAERATRIAEINSEMVTLLAEQIVERKMPPPVASVMDQALEDRHAEDLEKRYPHLQTLSADQLAVLSRLAHIEAEISKRPYTANSVAENMRLREDIARLSLSKKGIWYDVETAAAQPGQTRIPNAPNPPAATLTPKQAAAKAKVALANDLPPDIRNLGRTGDGGGPPSEASINRMTDIELENLPRAELERLAS